MGVTTIGNTFHHSVNHLQNDRIRQYVCSRIQLYVLGGSVLPLHWEFRMSDEKGKELNSSLTFSQAYSIDRTRSESMGKHTNTLCKAKNIENFFILQVNPV